MKIRIHVLSAFVIGAAAGLIAGCQTYDFEPVEPLALAKTAETKKIVSLKAKPNLMLLVDKSGSMHDPINPSDSRCTAGCGSSGTLCPANCPTRITDLKLAMRGSAGNNGFLTDPNSQKIARMGLAVFPNASASNACAAGGLVYDIVNSPEDLDADLMGAATQINTYIQNLTNAQVTGGTPTHDSMQTVGNIASLQGTDREDFVLLLTDGLPNCNPGLDQSSCTCVNTPTGSPPCGDNRNCLDNTRTDQKLAELAGKGVRTIVVGFGAVTGTAGLAVNTLNKLAESGGMARSCLNPDGTRDLTLCGGEACDTAGLCATRFYKAANATELVAALLRITRIISDTDPCVFPLSSKPSDPRLLTVEVNGTRVDQAADTWVYSEDATTAKVTFVANGRLCTQVLNATETNPVNVEFGVIQAL